MALAAGTYRGRLGGQIYQVEDPMGFKGVGRVAPQGLVRVYPEQFRQVVANPLPQLHGLGSVYQDAGRTEGQYGPGRLAMFGRTKLMYSLRHEQSAEAKANLIHAMRTSRAQFQTTVNPPTVRVTLGAIGVGGLMGALLATALL
jgi:hypothetical protein